MPERCHIYTEGIKCQKPATTKVRCGISKLGFAAYQTYTCTLHTYLYSDELYKKEPV